MKSGKCSLTVNLEGDAIEQSIKLGFKASKNEFESEVVINRMKLAISLGISKLKVLSDL